MLYSGYQHTKTVNRSVEIEAHHQERNSHPGL